MIPVLMIVAATVAFFIVERIFPGRDLREARGWYARAALQLSVNFDHSSVPITDHTCTQPAVAVL